MVEQITISSGSTSVVMPRVKAVDVSATEVAKETEMASGKMVKDVLGYRATITAVWDYVPSTTITALLGLLKTGGYFTVTYPAPTGDATGVFSVRYPSVGIFAFIDGAPMWHGVTLVMEAQEVES